MTAVERVSIELTVTASFCSVQYIQHVYDCERLFHLDNFFIFLNITSHISAPRPPRVI